MSENRTQESATKKTNQSTQKARNLRTRVRLPAPQREPDSVGGILNHTPSNLTTQNPLSWPAASLVQSKLTVNEPDDIYEQEADKVADAVMRMPNYSHASLVAQASTSERSTVPDAQFKADSESLKFDWATSAPLPLSERSFGSQLNPIQAKLSQRARAATEQRRLAAGQAAPITAIQAALSQRARAATFERRLAARQATIAEPPLVTPDIENRIQKMNGNGSPLPDSSRNFFEERMGADFSGVRIHTDNNATQTSRDLSARAFTTGNNIAFNWHGSRGAKT